ncbi:complement component C8 gamma chain [Scleropages formosus]|uniref:complement component C8 gamma chain n=1 Tax=Scleropages formosus TaxID=113540 RepID=UPI000878EC83|nr:complement component C8 gamma chain [Scleropages formosus]
MRAPWLYVSVTILLGFLLEPVGAAKGQRRGRRPPKQQPIDKIPAVQNLNLEQLNGKWFLISVASKCQYLQENNFRVESTTMTLSSPSSRTSPLLVDTLRKLNQQCLNIRQEYQQTGSSGRFVLKGHSTDINIVVAETDYNSYAILYYQKQDQITMKLYGRSTQLPDSIMDKFEQLAEKQNIKIDNVYPFPKYGFCMTADKQLQLGL